MSETLSGVYKFELVRYMCIYIGTCSLIHSSACHVYVMWAELGHSHFLYVPAVSNRALEFEFSIQSSVYGAATVAKVSLHILYLDTVYYKF